MLGEFLCLHHFFFTGRKTVPHSRILGSTAQKDNTCVRGGSASYLPENVQCCLVLIQDAIFFLITICTSKNSVPVSLHWQSTQAIPIRSCISWTHVFETRQCLPSKVLALLQTVPELLAPVQWRPLLISTHGIFAEFDFNQVHLPFVVTLNTAIRLELKNPSSQLPLLCINSGKLWRVHLNGALAESDPARHDKEALAIELFAMTIPFT